MDYNKTLVVITGCNRGLGQELDAVFKSYDCLCVNRKQYASHDCVMNLSEKNIDLNIIKERVESYPVVVFINNASSIEPIVAVRHIDLNDIERSMLINYINPAKIITSLIQLNKKIVIVNITSGAAFTSNSELALYSSGKAAMHRYIDILSLEEKENKDTLLITNFDPGRMRTDMQKELMTKKGSNIKNADLVEPTEVAKKVYDLVHGVLEK